MFKLTDWDLSPPEGYSTNYVSSAEILVPPINQIEQVGMVRCCSCGGVISGAASRIYDNLQAKINRHRHLTKSEPSETLHAQFLHEAEMAEPSVSNLCCTNLVESRPRISEPPDSYILRNIDDEEELLKRKRTARKGNTIIETFDPQPYNPYTYLLDTIRVEDPDDPQLLEDAEIQKLTKELTVPRKAKVISLIERYPAMPTFTEEDEFQEESPDLFAPVRGKYIVYGTSNTGLRGMEVPVIRSTSIYAG